MILLGIVLLVLAAGAGYVLFVGTNAITDNIEIGFLNGTVGLRPVWILITGAAVISVFWLGWALLRMGAKRSSRRRRETKDALAKAAADKKAQAARAEQEIAAREKQIAQERSLREQETARLKAEAEARVREQHLATETARARAEVAEKQLRSGTD